MTEGAGRWIGRPVRRREDPKFLRGRARYVDDLSMPGMIHMVVVRSTVGHARLRAVRLEAARGAGAMAAVAAGDVAGAIRPVPPTAAEGAQVATVPHPVLADGVVRYVGEPVAVVAAATRSAAEDAAALVEIDYDPLPAVTDVEQSLGAAVVLHQTVADNVLVRWERSHGDVDGAFRSAARVVEQTFRIPRLSAVPIEPRGAVAQFDPGSDLLTVWCSAQDPHRPLAQLARMLNRPDDRIRVIVPDVGGGFGSKGAIGPEVALAAWLAMRTGRPVKWVEDRRENLAASYQGRGVVVAMAMALDGGGRILAVRARVVADVGAYLFPSTPVVPVTASMLLTGAYAIPAASVQTLGVATNKVPTGPYRGAGRPEAAYVVERMLDLAAGELGVDPVELRRRNIIPRDRFPYRTPLGFSYDSGDYARALDRACGLVEYDRWRERQAAARREGRLVGVAVTLSVERAGAQLWESAAVQVAPSGRVVVRIGSTSNGQGHATIFAQIAAELLQVDLDAVTVEQGDSAVVPRGVGTFGSRSVTIGGSALVRAVEQVQSKAVAIAAHLLEGRASDVGWTDGRLHIRGVPDRSVTLAEVAAAAYQPARLPPDMEMGLAASAIFRLPGPVFPSGAYAAVVEVERDTGAVQIHRLVAVDDAGRIINPLLAEGQVIGAAVQGLGQVFSEEVVYDHDGQLLTSTLAEYALPRAAQVPDLTSEFLETRSPLNPLGAKGVGEAGTIAVPAVIANAVLDGLAPLGIRHLDFPLTPRRVWEMMRQAAAPPIRSAG